MGGAVIASSRILVTGAYGETGRWVVSYLVSRGHRVAALGRRAHELGRLATRHGPLVEPIEADVSEPEQLAAAIRDCDLAVNCVGPMRAVEDKVARAAVAAGRHYVDPGGSYELHERIAAQPVSVGAVPTAVVSAGWISGVSEIFPKHLLAVARRHMDEIHTFAAICGDNSIWSPAATTDVVNFVRGADDPMARIGRLKFGRWRRENFVSMWRRFDLPPPVGAVRAFSRHSHEFAAYAGTLPYETVSANVALISLRSLITLRLIRAARSIDLSRAVDKVNDSRLRDQRLYNVPTFVGAQITGTRGGLPARLSGVVAAADHYRATGTAAAVMASLVARGEAEPGLHYAAQATDPDRFMSAFAAEGFEIAIRGGGALKGLEGTGNGPTDAADEGPRRTF